jgi:hypothetical protein
MLKHVLALVVLASFSVVTALPAQDLVVAAPTAPPNLPLGERVRLTVSGYRVEGTVAGSDEGGVTLLMKNGVTYRAGRGEIDGLEIARPRSWLAGAGRGALIGGLSVGAITAASLPGQMKEPDGSCTDSFGAPQVCTTGRQVVEGLAMGALTGAVIGMLFPGTRWDRVEFDKVRVSVAPAPSGGVAVNASVGF